MDIEMQQWSDEELQAHLDQWDTIMQSGKIPATTLHENPGKFPHLDKMYSLTSDGSTVSLTLAQAFHIKQWMDTYKPQETPLQPQEQTYWQQDEKKDYLLLADPDKYMRAYVRADGCLNLLFYDDEWLFEHDRHSYDWHICEIDRAIERLQSIKAQAIQYFAKQGEAWPQE